MSRSRAIISTPLPDGAPDLEDETAADAEWRTVIVPVHLHRERLDRALAVLLPEFSRSYLRQLIEDGRVQVEAKRSSKAAQRIHTGVELSVELRPTAQSQAFCPERMALDIVYSDAELLVVHKPAGLVVHPAPGNWSGTLLNGLLAWDPALAAVPRAGIVHRLDKDTSGLMVVARTRQTMDALVLAIAARCVQRQYLAVGHKAWRGDRCASVHLPIGRDPRNRLRMAAVDLGVHPGKPAATDFKVLDSTPEACLVHCRLQTGRTHQIRVHMASMGHVLIGDALYGGAPLHGMHRQSLHAVRLAFVHPSTGHALRFLAPPPVDFVALLQHLGLRYNPADLG